MKFPKRDFSSPLAWTKPKEHRPGNYQLPLTLVGDKKPKSASAGDTPHGKQESGNGESTPRSAASPARPSGLFRPNPSHGVGSSATKALKSASKGGWVREEEEDDDRPGPSAGAAPQKQSPPTNRETTKISVGGTTEPRPQLASKPPKSSPRPGAGQLSIMQLVAACPVAPLPPLPGTALGSAGGGDGSGIPRRVASPPSSPDDASASTVFARDADPAEVAERRAKALDAAARLTARFTNAPTGDGSTAMTVDERLRAEGEVVPRRIEFQRVQTPSQPRPVPLNGRLPGQVQTLLPFAPEKEKQPSPLPIHPSPTLKGVSNGRPLKGLGTLTPTQPSSAPSDQQPLPAAVKRPRPAALPRDFVFPVASNQLFLDERLRAKVLWRGNEPVGLGLNNMGNTCFANSVLQALLHTPVLANVLSDRLHSSGGCRVQGFCFFCNMEKLRGHIAARQPQRQSTPSVSPRNIMDNLRALSKTLRLGHQEDAGEFLRFCLDALHENSLAGINNRKSLPTRVEETTPAHGMFGGYLRSQVRCRVCEYESNTYDSCFQLALEIVHSSSVFKALRHYTAEEKLDGDNMYFCPRCKKKVPALKQLSIFRAPNVLVIQLKRFQFEHRLGGKISKPVDFTHQLDLSPFMSQQVGTCSYTLYAVVVHMGYSSFSGHYICYVRSANKLWYRMDDSRVQQVAAPNVLQQQGYVLFYTKDSFDSWRTHVGREEEKGEESDRPAKVRKVDVAAAGASSSSASKSQPSPSAAAGASVTSSSAPAAPAPCGAVPTTGQAARGSATQPPTRPPPCSLASLSSSAPLPPDSEVVSRKLPPAASRLTISSSLELLKMYPSSSSSDADEERPRRRVEALPRALFDSESDSDEVIEVPARKPGIDVEQAPVTGPSSQLSTPSSSSSSSSPSSPRSSSPLVRPSAEAATPSADDDGSESDSSTSGSSTSSGRSSDSGSADSSSADSSGEAEAYSNGDKVVPTAPLTPETLKDRISMHRKVPVAVSRVFGEAVDGWEHAGGRAEVKKLRRLGELELKASERKKTTGDAWDRELDKGHVRKVKDGSRDPFVRKSSDLLQRAAENQAAEERRGRTEFVPSDHGRRNGHGGGRGRHHNKFHNRRGKHFGRGGRHGSPM